MKILIKKNAAETYVEYNTEPDGTYTGNQNLEDLLWQIQGLILEVDTESLFKYEYNVKPIPDITNSIVRIHDIFVEKIIDDIRKGKARCDFCNKTSESDQRCTNCGRTDYLEPFEDEYYNYK